MPGSAAADLAGQGTKMVAIPPPPVLAGPFGFFCTCPWVFFFVLVVGFACLLVVFDAEVVGLLGLVVVCAVAAVTPMDNATAATAHARAPRTAVCLLRLMVLQPFRPRIGPARSCLHSLV